MYTKGREIFAKEGYCITCHQPDGKGLAASGFPPLTGTNWVSGNEDRLIKLALKGLMGPIEVVGKTYPGQVPMTPFGGLLKDDEIAAVLTYVRNSFGNQASAIMPDRVKKVRASTEEKKRFLLAGPAVKRTSDGKVVPRTMMFCWCIPRAGRISNSVEAVS